LDETNISRPRTTKTRKATLQAVDRNWRRFLLTLCLVSFCLIAFDVWITNSVAGRVNARAQIVPTAVPFVRRVVSVRTGSHFKVGDEVDYSQLSPRERYRILNRPLIGDRFVLPVRRNGQEITVVLTATPVTYLGYSLLHFSTSWSLWASVFAFFWSTLFATIIAWRRPENVEARFLALLLLLNPLAGLLAWYNFVTSWFQVDATLAVLSQLLGAAYVPLIAAYALRFARPASRIRRILTALCYLAAAILLPASILPIVGTLTGTVDPLAFQATLWFRLSDTGVPVLLLMLVCAIVALIAARGSERARLAWAITSIVFPDFAGIGYPIALSLHSSSSGLWVAIGNAATILVPLGLTYSILNRRLLDIGFAFNRATIFAGVSLLVFAAFSLVEWGLGGWLSTMNRTTNLAVSAILALGLGLSLRPIHGQVERFVDRVLFRKRNENERMLRAFAHEAAYFTESDILIRETQRVIESRADASEVTLALDDGAGAYGAAKENDPVIVALRAWHKPVDLQTIESTLQGEFAYPMVARGRLIGALVVGPKQNGESYAPDESEAIARIANSVGNALDLLAAQRDSSNDRFTTAIERLTDGMERMSERLDRLMLDKNTESKA
jgi:hypothetical protein